MLFHALHANIPIGSYRLTCAGSRECMTTMDGTPVYTRTDNFISSESAVSVWPSPSMFTITHTFYDANGDSSKVMHDQDTLLPPGEYQVTVTSELLQIRTDGGDVVYSMHANGMWYSMEYDAEWGTMAEYDSDGTYRDFTNYSGDDGNWMEIVEHTPDYGEIVRSISPLH